MISQITNIAIAPLGNGRPASAQVVDIKSQRSSLASSAEEANKSAVHNDIAATDEEEKNVAKAKDKIVDLKTVKGAAEQVNKVLRQINRDLQFSVDDDTGTSIVKVIDNQSKEVIRQIPSQEVLEMSKALDKLQGLLFKEKV